MDRDVCWKQMGFLSIDYKALQRWLDGLGAQGWRLDAIRCWYLGRFVREAAPVAYSVALRNGNPDYLALCGESGWRRFATRMGLDVFVSAPGERPVPVETDPALEARKAAGSFLRSTLGNLFALALLAGFGLYLFRGEGVNSFLCRILESNWSFCYTAVLLVYLAVTVVWLAPLSLAWWLRCRRADAVEEARPRTARVRGFWGQTLMDVLPVACLVLALAAALLQLTLSAGRLGHTEAEIAEHPVVRAADLGLERSQRWNGSIDSPRLDRNHSFFIAETSYYAAVDTPGDGYGAVDCRRYACRFGWVAAVVAEDEREGMEPIALGFDAAWIRRYDGHDELLIRQGNVVARVEAPVDLTDPSVLRVVADRLGLEGAA